MKKVLLWLLLGFTLLLGITAGYLYLTPQGKNIRMALGIARTAATAAMSFRPDGRWWDCTGVMRQGAPCSHEGVAAIELTAEEKALMAQLDKLPAPPSPLTEEQLLALMGKAPKKVDHFAMLTVFDWPGTSPGAQADGKLAITLGYGQLYEVKWIEPKRFFLWKRNDLRDTKPAS